jgi:hypothetical protein
VTQSRHGRACPGHPRLAFGLRNVRKTWMAGIKPA